jgi:hypothetical protein
MTTAEIRQLAEATPFVPIRLHLADGRKLDVPHPDFLYLFKTESNAILESERGGWQLVNLPIVVSVERLQR